MLEYFKIRRNVVALMVFCATTSAYILRVNLSVAIVDMTIEHFVTNPNGTISTVQYFKWNSMQKGNILSAFFYGYIFTQIAGGYFSTKYGGVTILGLAIGGTAVCTLLTPLCAQFGANALVVLRIMEGILGGVIFPSINVIWSVWSPPSERTKLSGIAFSGCGIGTVLGFAVCGVITDTLGWAYAFYIPGAVALIWYALWLLFITSDPRDDPYIRKDELNYLKESLREKGEKHNYPPWKDMITSLPVWAIIIGFVSENWGENIFLTQLPTYLKQRYNFDATKAGILLMIPYIIKSINTVIAGIIADKLRKKMLSTTQVRRLFTCISSSIEAIFTALVAYVDSPITAIICLVINLGFGNGFTLAGYCTNPLDLAPKYSGVIYGIANTFGTLSGILCPNVAGYIVRNGTEEEWRTVFLITAGVYLVNVILYGLLVSGVKQPWAENENDLDPKEEELKMYIPQKEISCP